VTRKVFFSFHFKPDFWRTSQVRQIGALEGNAILSDNDWEEVKKRGDEAVKTWIDEQLKGKSCVVVLIGSDTSTRKWVTYEISRGWNQGKGVVGIYIHNLKDQNQDQSTKGKNPLDEVTFKKDQSKLSSVAKAYDPPYSKSTDVYDYIASNIESWIEEALKIRTTN
jgi:hypothetical protein